MKPRKDRVYRDGNFMVMVAPDDNEFLMPVSADENVYMRKGYRPLTPEAEADKGKRVRLTGDEWKGKRCFIVGGGPSLKGFDWSSLDGELSIGINRALEFYNPTIAFSIDSRWFEWTTGGSFGQVAKRKYENFKGHKVFLNANGYINYPDEVQQVLPYPHPRRISRKLKDGICHGDNSGMAAINLAICLGATEIYLLGFDCNVTDGQQEHFHDGYPKVQRAKVYQKFIASMNLIAPSAAKYARVINCNPNSGLECFEFGNLPWDTTTPPRKEPEQVDDEPEHIPTPAPIPKTLADGIWKDQPCVIVGGGSSLKGFDFGNLIGYNTIAINRAYEVCDPSIMFATDHRLFYWIRDGKFGNDTRERFESLKCYKLLGAAVSKFNGHYDNDGTLKSIMANEPRDDDMAGDLTESIDDGLLRSTSSGVPALNLALNLGANPIYLLGFDCQPSQDGSEHYHDGYKDFDGRYNRKSPFKTDNAKQPFEKHIAGFERIADAAKARARIVNCSNWSALTCFEFGKLPKYVEPQPEAVESTVQPDLAPIFISYATPAYRGHADTLKASLEAHGCEHDIAYVKDAGSWEANCAMKPTHIKNMRKKHKGRRVVWVDADAVIREDPILFTQLNGVDFGFYRLGDELLSGTLYFAPTGRATRLLTRWEKEQESSPETWDQRTLDKALVGWKGESASLPASYCKIFDNRRQRNFKPIIEHNQASRQLKRVAQ